MSAEQKNDYVTEQTATSTGSRHKDTTNSKH